MRKLWTAILLAVMLCALVSIPSQAEVKLVDFHALHLDISRYYFYEYTLSIYERGFRQYSQAADSNAILDPYAIASDKATNVPVSGDELVVFIENSAYYTSSEAGFYYSDPNLGSSLYKVPLDKLQAVISAFPGRVVVIVDTFMSTGDRVPFMQALAAAFPTPKYTLAAHIVDYDVRATRSTQSCKALGFGQYGSPPLDKIYADANGDRIVTAREFHNYFQSAFGAKAAYLFSGDDLPIYFSTTRLKLGLPEAAHTISGRETYTIVPVTEPAGATDFLTWSTSNKSVATVKDGVVTGVAPGKTVITMKGDGKTFKMTVTVGKVAATTVSIVPPEKDVYMGDKVRLTARLEPANAIDPVISWSSSAKRIATVDKNGVLRALKEGETVITVKTRQGLKGMLPITVKKVAVTNITVDGFSGNVPMLKTGTVGINIYLKAAVLPVNASYRSYRWTSSDPSVATISSVGKVNPKKPGTTTLSVVAVDDPSKFYEVILNVVPNELVWPAPIPADFTSKQAGLYQLPKRLYYSGSTMIGEVYLYNHTASSIKSLAPFYACLVDSYYYNDDPEDPDAYLYIKKKGRYTFSRPIAPETAGVYRFSIPLKKKIDLYLNDEYEPMLFGR